MKYKKYPSYKDSGVEWLGEIPSEWEKIPARAIVSNLMKKNTDNKDDRYLSLMANIGVIRYEDKGDVGNKKPDDLSKCKIVNKGNLIINSMNYSIGSFGMSQYDGICSPVYVVLDINKIVIDSKYALRIFENSGYQKFISSFGNGILAHRAAIGWDEIKGSYMPLPSIHEQQQIANFLDKATAKIDTLIEKQTKQIELLKEKRQAVISHAVTKGINPNVPMKDSGVEWLGEIPEHWKIIPLRHLGQLQNGVSKGSDYFGSGYPFINYGDIYNNDIIPSQINGFAQSSLEDRIAYSVKKGDMFFTRTSETIHDIGMASTCLQTIPNATFSGFTIRFRQLKEVLIPSFSRYQFRSGYSQSFFVKEMNLVTRASLGQDLLKRLHTIVPPLKEQQQIANYLDDKTSKIDTLIEKSNRSIELLKEKRTAIISAAVTGKIDVREFE